MVHDRGRVCAETCCVAVAVTHAHMRAMIIDLLDREPCCWSAIAVSDPASLPSVLAEAPVDLVVVDGADFPRCCRDLSGLALDHVVVIGAEPDRAYEAAAFAHGAGAWLPRDRVGEDLADALHGVLVGSHAQDTAEDRLNPPAAQVLPLGDPS